MTALLKDALAERAAAEEAPHLDLDAIVRTGDRRIRRRRTLTGVAAAAAVVAVVAGGLLVLDRPVAEPPPAGRTAPFAERKVTWSSGDTIHYGDRDIDVRPVTVAAFVQTDNGFVLVDPEGEVYVADGDRVAKVGTGNLSVRLKADDTGPFVGWVDFTPRIPEYVVYDVAARREVVRTAEGNTAKTVGSRPGMRPGPWPGAPTVVAIDGGYAYFAAGGPLADGAGLRRWDIAAGRGRLVKAGLRPDLLADVSAGRYVVLSGSGSAGSVFVSPNPGASTPRFAGEFADLSPGGRSLFVAEDDGNGFYSMASGRPVTVSHAEHPRLYGSQWIDDDRFVALGLKEPADQSHVRPMDLVTCSIGAGACTVSARNVADPAVDEASPEFQLPIGRRLGDDG